jgi:hypothetical protein
MGLRSATALRVGELRADVSGKWPSCARPPEQKPYGRVGASRGEVEPLRGSGACVVVSPQRRLR